MTVVQIKAAAPQIKAIEAITMTAIAQPGNAKKDVAAKPSSSSGGKKAKKKWSAKKVKDKANNLVILDQPTHDRLFKEVPTYKLISQSVLVDRLKLNGSLARIAIRELEAQGLIKAVSRHHAQVIYTRATGDEK
ncbi:hypothetical protein G6F56_003285 [Rhizopus delemar]|nr:hypothetical protein G6F56_003285 [Rhizopus delemar]